MQTMREPYMAKNISTEKMLEALDNMRETAHRKHFEKEAMEDARYEQELKDIERFSRMFHCSNFEKDGADNGKAD